MKGLRLFLKARCENELRLDYIANCVGVLAKGQNYNNDFELFTVLRENARKPIDTRDASEIKSDILKKLNE